MENKVIMTGLANHGSSPGDGLITTLFKIRVLLARKKREMLGLVELGDRLTSYKYTRL